MDDYFTTEQLKARGWTSRMIKTHLGKPDATKPDPRGRLRKPIQLYARDRVLHIEETAARDDLGKLIEARDLARRAVAARKCSPSASLRHLEANQERRILRSS